MYCKSIDDYLVNIHAGRSIVPYMMKEFEKKGIDTSDIKAMTDYLKYADAEEAEIFNLAWDEQMNDDIDAGLWDKREAEVEWQLENEPEKFVTIEKFLENMAVDGKARDNTEKQIAASRKARLERVWK